MGNCFTVPTSDSFYASSRSSSWHSSVCRTLSTDSVTAMDTPASRLAPANSVSVPRRILPFPTVRDLNNIYELSDELGKGQFGTIRLCKCRETGIHYACKSISKRYELDLPDILREVLLMQRLMRACSASKQDEAASHIVRLHQVIEDDLHVHLILELCRGGELFHRIAKKICFCESDAAAILKALMQSIAFCHSVGIMHRDVKPENILFLEDSDDSCIKLADFGLAVEFSPGQKFSDLAGSAYYVAPEVLNGEYSQEIDVWSAGVVLYVMLSGVAPFNGETDEEIFNAIREGKLPFEGRPWSKISFPAKDLILKMLAPNPKKRLTPKQVLEHPWILRHCKAVHKNKVGKMEANVKTTCANVSEMEQNYQQKQQTSFVNSSLIPDDVVRITVKQEISEDTSFQDLNNHQPVKIETPLNKDLENISSKDSVLASFVAHLKEKKLTMLADGRLDGKKLTMVADGRLDEECNKGWTCVVRSSDNMGKLFALDFGERKYLITCSNMKKADWKTRK
ncbi:hypothetical protein KP509_36G004600 [Ceratopteris richardii]|uniref:Protein kinase domain-containing protein n=1 Tax=Ceratopteris richardii TaxID=49495 RepID=A0A8T2QBI3_CERRI|nr:hypothetical protein KP509_36G004600 [Ceratopteris richardii]